jgi:hypothetical protein
MPSFPSMLTTFPLIDVLLQDGLVSLKELQALLFESR